MHLLALLLLFITTATASVSFSMPVGDLSLNQPFNLTWTTNAAPVDLTLEKVVNGSLFGSVVAKNVQRDWFTWKPTTHLKNGEYFFKIVDSKGASDTSAGFVVDLSTVSALSFDDSSSSSSSSSFSSSSSIPFSTSSSSPTPSLTSSSPPFSLATATTTPSTSPSSTSSPTSTPSGLSPASIAGIAISVCGALVLAVALFYLRRFRRTVHDLEATPPPAPLPQFPPDTSYERSISTAQSMHSVWAGGNALEAKLHPCISVSSSHYSHKDFSSTFSATTTLTQNNHPEISSTRSSVVHMSHGISPSILQLDVGSPYDSAFPSFSSPTSPASSPRPSLNMATSFYPEDISALVSPLAVSRRPELYTHPRSAPSPPISRSSSIISPLSSRRGSSIRSSIRSFLRPLSPPQTTATTHDSCVSPIDALLVEEEEETPSVAGAGPSPLFSRKRSSAHRSRYKSGNFGMHPLQMNRAVASDAGSECASTAEPEASSTQQQSLAHEAAPAVISMGSVHSVVLHKTHQHTEQTQHAEISGPAVPPQSRRHVIPRRPVPNRAVNDGGWI